MGETHMEWCDTSWVDMRSLWMIYIPVIALG